jgi:hypothetical protein
MVGFVASIPKQGFKTTNNNHLPSATTTTTKLSQLPMCE